MCFFSQKHQGFTYGVGFRFFFLKNFPKKQLPEMVVKKFPYSGKFWGSVSLGVRNHGVDTSHIRTGSSFQMVDFGKFQNTKE